MYRALAGKIAAGRTSNGIVHITDWFATLLVLAALPVPDPHVVNLLTDPKEREPYNAVYLHTWTAAHFARLLKAFRASVAREPLIPAAAVDYVPTAPRASSWTGNLRHLTPNHL